MCAFQGSRKMRVKGVGRKEKKLLNFGMKKFRVSPKERNAEFIGVLAKKKKVFLKEECMETIYVVETE